MTFVTDRMQCLMVAVAVACCIMGCTTADSSRCRVVTIVTADDIRSRPTYVAINVPSLDPTLRLAPNDNNAAKKNQLKSTFSSTQGVLLISDVSTYVEESRSNFEVGITFSQNTSYRTFSSDMANLTIPQSYFNATDQAAGGCTVSIPVLPSAGAINVDGIATTIFEVAINTGNTSFDMVLENDEFSSAATPIISPSPLPLGLAPMVVTRVNAFTLRFILRQDETLNINTTASSGNTTSSFTIHITFQPNVTRTGISPEVGSLKQDYLELTLSPSVPSVRVSYPPAYDGSAVPSEELWDGTALVYLDIQGDTWLPNETLWTAPGTRPTFASAPFQESGFDLLRNVSSLRVSVSGRRATLSWSPCYGFAVASRQTVSVSDWKWLTSEGQGDIVFAFSVLPATASSVSVTFAGGPNIVRVQPNQRNATDCLLTDTLVENCTHVACVNTTRWRESCTFDGTLPWRCNTSNVTMTSAQCNGTMLKQAGCSNMTTRTLLCQNRTSTTNNVTAYAQTTEFNIRRNGVSINVSIYHDTISPALDASTLQEALGRNPSLALSTSSLQFIKHNTTFFTITFAADIAYNVDANEKVLIAITPSLLSSRGDLINNVLELTIASVPTPVCEYPSTSPIISSETVRQGTVVFQVLVRNDTICDRSQLASTVIPFVTTTKGLLSVLVNTTDTNTSRILFYVPQLASYSISSFDQIYLPMTPTPFCSLEACQASPMVDSELPHRVTISVRPSAGVLQLILPTVNETVMRVTPLTADIVIRGDVFSQVGLTFYPTFTVAGSTLDVARGFVGTIRKSCFVTVDAINASKAKLFCTANSTYDISSNETVSVSIPRTVMASLEPPDGSTSSTKPLVVIPVRGSIGSIIGVSTVLNESSIIAGGFTMSFTLLYERWAPVAAVASAVRASYPARTTNNSDFATTAFLSTFLGSTAFAVLDGDETLVITLPALPSYDIVVNETFFLFFGGLCVVSGTAPLNNNFSFTVVPSAGYFTANGSALLFGVRDLLTTRLDYTILLHNDLWGINVTYVPSELCAMTQCTVVASSNRRSLQVFLEPNPDFYIPVDTNYPIILRSSYVVSRAAPVNPTNQRMRVYITPGILTWAGPAASTSESVVRGGTMPSLFVTMRGDLFTTPEDVYFSILHSTACSIGPEVVASFCNRLPFLLQPSRITITDGSRVAQITFQPDAVFDAAVPEQVTFALDGRATQSRVAPTNKFSFVVTPVAGSFACSGLPADLSAVDLAGGPTSRPVRLRLTVTGDRFLHNTSLVVPSLRSGGFSIAGGPGAFSIYQGLSMLIPSMLTPEASELSDDDRTLTLTFMPNSDYLSDEDEFVNVTIPGGALVSGLPALTSSGLPCRFTIAATTAQVTISPPVLYASALRTVGADIFLTIASGGTWEQSYVQVGSNIFNATMCDRSPVEEPYGCSRYRGGLFSQVLAQGALINGSALVFRLLPVPSYDIVFPEALTFELTANWTTAELPPVPARLKITIAPDPLVLYAVVSIQIQERVDGRTHIPAGDRNETALAQWTPSTADAHSFRMSVSEWLNIPSSLVEVVSNVPEERIGNLSITQHVATIGFRVRNMKRPSPYYDDSIAADFLGMAPAVPLTSGRSPLLSWRSFRPEAPAAYGVVVYSVFYAFSSAQAPQDYIWEYIRSGALPDNSSFVFPLTPLAVFGIAMAVVVVVILAIVVRREVIRSRTQGGLGRSGHKVHVESTGKAHADAVEDSLRAEEQHNQDAVVFSGQKGADHSLRGAREAAQASRQWRSDPRRSALALNPETVDRDIPILVYAGQASQSPPRAEELTLDIDAFLEDNGYMPPKHRAAHDATGDRPKQRVHRVTANEAKIQKAALAAGLAISAAKEGDVVVALDPLEGPFDHVVYPVWSQSRPGAFRPPSKFHDDLKDL